MPTTNSARRGDIWTALVAGKNRPVLILTRDGVSPNRELVTVAAITTVIRDRPFEVPIENVGLNRQSVANCDALYTVAKTSLKRRVGGLDAGEMRQVCSAVAYAFGCDD
jgi:mRNA interferase MazF